MAEALPATYEEPFLGRVVGIARSTVRRKHAILGSLEEGSFTDASYLLEWMFRDPRFRGVNETRANGLLSLPIRWRPSGPSDASRLAAQAIVDDWPKIAPSSERKKLHTWSLNLGVALAQKAWRQDRTSGRFIPTIQCYSCHFVDWDHSRRMYRVQTDAGVEYVAAAALGSSVDAPTRWVVCERGRSTPWRSGMIHSALDTCIGHADSIRQQARCGEKSAIESLKVKYPRTADKAAVERFVNGLKNAGGEMVIPCAENQDGTAFDVNPLEFSGKGYDVAQKNKDSFATDLAVLYLGHNLTAEAQGGSYAAANVGDLIRDDYKGADVLLEQQVMAEQVLSEWAAVNFGDASAAPIAEYGVDVPTMGQPAAQALATVAGAVEALRAAEPSVDVPALLKLVNVPLVGGGE